MELFQDRTCKCTWRASTLPDMSNYATGAIICIIFYLNLLSCPSICTSSACRSEREAAQVLPTPFYKRGGQGSYKWVSCLVLHTVKIELCPGASQSPVTHFPEPEEAPALQLHTSRCCYQNLVLIFSEIKITQDHFTDQGVGCWQDWVLDYGPKADKLELGPTLTI